MTGIYKITNKTTQQCYIGQSRDLERRLNSHIRSHENSAIDRAIFKNPCNFTYEILELCSEEELNDREIYWIDYFDSYVDGYNQTYGGTFRFNPTKRSITLLSDDDIKLIRQCYASQKYNSGAEVQREFFPHLDRHLIAEVYNGQLKPEIMPEVYNQNYTHEQTQKVQLGEKNPASVATENDVILIRVLYTIKTRDELYAYVPHLKERTIVSILSGQNWKHMPIYKKKEKRWTFPSTWTQEQIDIFNKRKDDILNEYRNI